MELTFRQAIPEDTEEIWNILQQAIILRREQGSDQWQDGYPNLEVIRSDVEKRSGHVLLDEEKVIGYVAILINDEPQYARIEGAWLSDDDFVVLHRVAISQSYLGRGLAKVIMRFVEDFALKNNIYSIKGDTNFDNNAMMRTFESVGYVYCGEVYFRGSARRAYEKLLVGD